MTAGAGREPRRKLVIELNQGLHERLTVEAARRGMTGELEALAGQAVEIFLAEHADAAPERERSRRE